jgi:hypothetical protein
VTNPPADTELVPGGELVMLGTISAHQEFVKEFS